MNYKVSDIRFAEFEIREASMREIFACARELHVFPAGSNDAKQLIDYLESQLHTKFGYRFHD